MKFSTRTRYGIRAMLDIAADKSDNGVFQKDIAERQGISNKYLDQIIRALKVAGLIVNARGKKSGYILTKKPSEITLLDIHSAFEPGITVVECMNSSVNCNFEDRCKAKTFWGNLNQLVIKYFKSVSLLDLIEGDIPKEIKI
ncbi:MULTISPECIES: RrF2 family transcriptional regulator [unclassified Saccharicrinis]|uniref:RrF2 family transcriptional regulator n=1 Tax=unclassified Saccharicrinis TaxID=2646859 RepID=UPI003D352DBD